MSCLRHFRKRVGGIAQLVERLVRNEKVRGSNPLTSTKSPVIKAVKSNNQTIRLRDRNWSRRDGVRNPFVVLPSVTKFDERFFKVSPRQMRE
jgi:hypothetical protein